MNEFFIGMNVNHARISSIADQLQASLNIADHAMVPYLLGYEDIKSSHDAIMHWIVDQTDDQQSREWSVSYLKPKLLRFLQQQDYDVKHGWLMPIQGGL